MLLRTFLGYDYLKDNIQSRDKVKQVIKNYKQCLTANEDEIVDLFYDMLDIMKEYEDSVFK